jgi:hypothetical protein
MDGEILSADNSAVNTRIELAVEVPFSNDKCGRLAQW